MLRDTYAVSTGAFIDVQKQNDDSVVTTGVMSPLYVVPKPSGKFGQPYCGR